MQFQVPQFIETEDKIMGPLTLKQFLYLAAAAVLSFLSFFVLTTFLWLTVTAVLAVIAAAFAFVKYNGRPLSLIAFSAFKYVWNPKMYLWQRKEKKLAMPEVTVVPAKKAPMRIPLKNLWLKLSTGAQATRKQPAIKEIQKEKYEALKKATGERDVARRVDYR